MKQEEIVQAPTATLFYGRKVGLPNYSNEEFSCFLQVPLDDINSSDNKQVEALLDEQTAFLKAFVLKQLSIAYTVPMDSGIVTPEVPVADTKGAKKPYAKKAAYKSGADARGGTSGPTDKAMLWELLATATKHGEHFKASNGETIWDNRQGKRNPNAPDFKFADSGEGLWLDKMPADIELPV